jgi:hypothetical protein
MFCNHNSNPITYVAQPFDATFFRRAAWASPNSSRDKLTQDWLAD